MPNDEFSLINDYFANRSARRSDVVIGIGDDGAVVKPMPEHDIVVVTDTLVEGVHFDKTTPPRAIGHKAVAVNLSDLAAMGAQPSWVSLALTCPNTNQDWWTEFSSGLDEICRYYDCQLIGGDTTKGPLTITVTAHGQLPSGTAISRSGAKPGDWVYVSGSLGDAGLGLQVTQNKVSTTGRHLQHVIEKLHYPTPRVAMGQVLRGVATSCIDVSDGLIADLGHLLNQAQVSAQINLEKLPLSLALTETLNANEALAMALTAGDDYELCFTLPEEHRGRMETLTSHLKTKPVCIGRIMKGAEAKINMHYEGEPWELPQGYKSFNHFAEEEIVKEGE
ncbi:thiamine-monophosphate kinase [Idiomarina sp. WRN-38]|uniref:thiamine-phosphate kinase n=1 Tax=Idiomarina sp. OXR-189 TaxID=3100175 RepID=UPI000733697A|nr:thiamine-phosphate kinase [Idiomarina sp. OXR-189]KTG29814.1 thiamine-monophosphate kinase [Idiomarina sp. H105]OAF13205.1 thiamine-monophosphate kinase [Idiomarina sp. WRN-38]WPZ00889.1 thiamine-phosphate kinase [Idiomarina sp. OXR-189]